MCEYKYLNKYTYAYLHDNIYGYIIHTQHIYIYPDMDTSVYKTMKQQVKSPTYYIFIYKCGYTALHNACIGGHLNVVTYLLSQGASLTAQDNVSTRIIISSFVTLIVTVDPGVLYMISIICVVIITSYQTCVNKYLKKYT